MITSINPTDDDLMQPHPPAPARLYRVGLTLVTAFLVLALGAVLKDRVRPATGSRPSSPAGPAFVVSGAVSISDRDSGSFTRDGRGGCAGAGDYAEVRDGALVVIVGDVQSSAFGQLTDGRVLTDGTCRFWFAVPKVPSGQDHYRLVVAYQDGGDYTEADLKGTLVTVRLGG